MVNTVTGRVGLPPTFHLPLAGAPAARNWLSAEAAKSSGVIFVSDFGNNAVYSYSEASPGAPLTTITTGIGQPLGNCVDAKGTLYVANSAFNTVTAYPRGKTVPSKTFSAGLAAPSGCTVGANGTLYVAEFSRDTVVEFAAGGKKPARTLSINKPEGVALDGGGSLYVSYITPGGNGAVEQYAPASTSGKDLGILAGYAGDVKIGKAGDIVLEDQTAGAVDFFKLGQTAPYGEISMHPDDPYKMALDPSGKLLYIATFGDVVGIYSAQPGGSEVGAIREVVSESSGVSTDPAFIP